MPGGSWPAISDQVYGAAPPEAATPALYARCVVPPGKLAVVIVSGAGGINVTLPAADLLPSSALVAITCTELCDPTVAGAVYRPPAVIVPAAGLRLHLTAVFDAPVTGAVNCCDAPPARLTEAGATLTTTTAGIETLAWADLVPSALLIALTTTDVDEETVAGAVYRPLVDTVPAPFPPAMSATVHVTAVFVVPETFAVNCCDLPGGTTAEFGETATPTVGVTPPLRTDTAASAVLVESATLCAETTPVIGAITTDGAV